MSADDKKPFSFDFGTGRASGPEGVPLGATEGDGATSAASLETAEATAHLAGVRKRGRPAKNDPERALREATAREELLRELHSLFDPEQWGAICRGPADLMLHISKRDLWRIEDRELKPLSVGAAHTARLFLQADPKWIALFMFSVSLTQIYGARIALHIAQSRREEREGRDKKDVPPTAKPV